MTDEKLIEEAAKAIADVHNAGVFEKWPQGWIEEARAAFAVFEKAHTPSSDEREVLVVASPDVWGWDACVVCGSESVSDRGMVVLISKTDGPYISRIGWCDQTQECRDDLRQAGASMLTAEQAEAIDAHLRRSEEPEPQGEPTPINGKWACGKCAREIAFGHDDGQIPEHHRTCPKRTQGEPSDVTLGIMAQRFYEASGLSVPMTSKPQIVAGLRAALRAAGETP